MISGTTPAADQDAGAMSWDEVVRTYGDRVYKLAYRLSGNRHDAEDITQEVFIRVFKSLDRFEPGSFSGWLHRITTNVFLDMVRRQSKVRMRPIGDETAQVPSNEPTPEQSLQDGYLDPDLQAALDDLAPEFRAAVVLCDVEGLTYEEIGEVLGVKVGTVRSRIHRGRRNLRAGFDARRAARLAAGEWV
jgi:RNA polymerase sigma-70 factor (ECF subfamily)